MEDSKEIIGPPKHSLKRGQRVKMNMPGHNKEGRVIAHALPNSYSDNKDIYVWKL